MAKPACAKFKPTYRTAKPALKSNQLVIHVNSTFHDQLPTTLPALFSAIPFTSYNDEQAIKNSSNKHIVRSLLYGGHDDALLQLQKGEAKAYIFLISTAKNDQNHDFALDKIQTILNSVAGMPQLFGNVLQEIPVLFLGVNVTNAAEQFSTNEMEDKLQICNDKIKSWKYAADAQAGLKWLQDQAHTPVNFQEQNKWQGFIHQ